MIKIYPDHLEASLRVESLRPVILSKKHSDYKFFVKILLLLCTLFYLFSCAPVPHRVVQPPKTDYVTASWYGPKFHGRLTASGEKFDMYAMTCAHREFPFGTRLRVTNLGNKKSVVVTVNDRGPFIHSRELDLSYAAAEKIGLIGAGVAQVRIESLGRDMRYVKSIKYIPSLSLGPFTVQVGAFREKTNAERLKQGLQLKHEDVYITITYLNRQKFYRVRIGTFDNIDRAYSFAKILAEEGYSIFITKKH